VSLPSLSSAAAQAAAHQDYPAGALYTVATPIGNLADIGLRALHVLSLVDAVACEDTRHTAALLQHLGLHRPLIAVHEHNEAEAAVAVVARLQRGERVAYVSDAGTPGLSDPGARLVAAAQTAGLRCVPVPGPSALTALISVAGAAGWDGRFVFHGFLPAKAAERARAVQALAGDPRAHALLEAPHRIEALAADLAALGGRGVTVGRELTKQFEEVATLAANGLPAWLTAHPHRTRGEFALLVHPAAVAVATTGLDDSTRRLLARLLQDLPVKAAVKAVADVTGQPRNALYDEALRLRGDAAGDDGDAT